MLRFLVVVLGVVFFPALAFAQPSRILLEDRIRTSCGSNTLIFTGSSNNLTCDSALTWESATQKFVMTSPGPTWASYNNIYNALRISNGFPVTSEFGNNTTGITQLINGALDIPATSAASNHGAGVAGYARTGSTTQGAVGTFGFGGITANGASSWGGNFLVTNCPSAQCATNTGYTDSVQYGIEIDLNIYKRSGGLTPNAAIRGLYIIGGSEIKPSSIAYAVNVDSFGVFQSPKLKWDSVFRSEVGASDIGLDLGPNLTGSSAGSQKIRLQATNSGGTPEVGIIEVDPTGNVVLSPDGTAIVALQSGVTIGTGGSVLRNMFTGSATYDPPSLIDGEVTSTTVTVTGCAVDSPAVAALSTLGTSNFQISAHIQTTNTARVVLRNVSGGTLDILSGSLKVICTVF